MDISKLLLNQARLRILQYISLHGQATASEVCISMQDIPRATIYKHTKILEDHGLLKIVQENRVRGAMEKVYTVNNDALSLEGEGATHLATSYFIELMQEFEDYYKGEEANPKRDKIFFTSNILNVSDEEYQAMIDKVVDTLKEYMELPPSDNRRARKLSLISTLPIE